MPAIETPCAKGQEELKDHGFLVFAELQPERVERLATVLDD
jgi:hypothetical protein